MEKIEGKNCVNHKDYNRKNKDVTNLEWVNHKENNQYSSTHYKVPRNRKKQPKYGKGIKFKNNKYELSICKHYIGRYETLEAAERAREENAKKYYYKF